MLTKLRTIRKNKGLSLSDVAERAALSTMAVSYIERGQPPTLKSALALADALDVSLDDLMVEGEHAYNATAPETVP